MKDLFRIVSQRYLRSNKKAVSVLAIIITFVMVYTLIMPAVAIERSAAENEPGMTLEETVSGDVMAEAEPVSLEAEAAPAEESESDAESVAADESEAEGIETESDVPVAAPAAENSAVNSGSPAADTSAAQNSNTAADQGNAQAAAATETKQAETEVIDDPSASDAGNTDAEEGMPAQKFEQIVKFNEIIDEDGNTVEKQIKVKVDAEENAFPAGTVMKAEVVLNNTDPQRLQDMEDAIETAVKKAAGESGLNAADTRVIQYQAIDISFFNKEGEKIDPAKKVEVRITSDKIREIENPVLVHINENDKTGEIKNADVIEKKDIAVIDEKPDTVANNENTMLFKASRFSPFVIVESETVDENGETMNGLEGEYSSEAGFGFADGNGETGNHAAADGSGVLMTSDGDYNVTVTYSAEANIPANAELQVKEITETSRAYQDYMEEAKDVLGGEDTSASINYAKIFDVDIVSDGEVVTPEAEVDVDIAYNKSEEIEEGTVVQAIQFGEGTPAVNDDAFVYGDETHIDGVQMKAAEIPVTAIVGTGTITAPFVSGDGRTYEVTVTYGNNAGIPANAKLQVYEVRKNDSEYNDYVERTVNAVAGDADSLNYIKLLDISIVDENNNKVTLLAPVDVQIRLMDVNRAGESTRIVHFADNKDPEVIIPEVNKDTVSFETGGFSIYAIYEGDEEVVPRRTYKFVRLNEETGAIEPYQFYNEAGELVDNQIIKTGDALEEINVPYIADEETWDRWRVVEIVGYDPDNTDSKNYTSMSYGRDVVFGQPLTVTESETIYVIPFFGKYHTVTFIDYLFTENHVRGYLIHNKEEVPLGATYDTTVQTVPNHKSVGGSGEADLVFAGWRLLHDESEMTGYFTWEDGELKLKPGVTWDQVDPLNGPDGHAVPGVTRDENNYVISIEMDPDQSRNYVLLPVYEEAHWVEYYSAPAGSGATYVPPIHVAVRKTAAEAGAEPDVTMNWRGYAFQYWTLEETFDANGKPIEFAAGNEPTPFNFNQTLTSDIKLNAYWKKADTTYTVMYWRQQMSDDKGLEADEKHYDYAGQRTGTGVVGSTVTLTDADRNMSSKTYNPDNDDYLKYVGFYYAKTDAAEKTVNADGSTVVNVYYDRNLITMNFDRDVGVYTPTEATTGTQYGLVEGEYVPLNRNGGNWSYYTYSPTDSNQGTQYGLVNGEYVQLTNYYGYWYYGYTQYNGIRYIRSDTQVSYTGVRYTRSTTRSFTGLFGQRLEKYGYTWPSGISWNYDTTGNGSKGMSYLGEFVLPNDVRDTTHKVINLRAAGSPTNFVDFYLQDPEETQLTNLSSYDLDAVGSYDYSPYTTVSFTLSDKYEGYTVYGYRRYTGTGTNKNYIDRDIVPAVVDNQVPLKGRTYNGSYSYNLAVYYKVYSYNVTYKDPVTREELSEKAFNYGAEIDNTGAPAKSIVEGHVPEGYRLKTDDNGNIIWYADPSMEVEFNFDRTMPNHDLEVFPGYEPIYYWVKIEPNGGELRDTESTWFWKRHGDTSIYEYTDVERKYIEDPNGEWYYHYDEFVDPVNDVNQYGTQTREAEYRKISDYDVEGSTWEDDSYDGKRYSPSPLYSLDGWYEVTIDEETGSEVLIPHRFGSPITHNTTLRAVWIRTGAFATVYKTEGVDKDGNPLFTYVNGNKTYLVTKNSDGTYTYKDDDDVTQTLSQEVGESLPRLKGSNAPVGGRSYEDESDTIILHRPDAPAGYVCTGYYFNGDVYLPGNVFQILSALDGADGDIDQQFTFYPIYEPFTDREVEITDIHFDPNVEDVSSVEFTDEEDLHQLEDVYENEILKQHANLDTKVVDFLNRQINAEMKLLGTIYSRTGYELKGWSLTPGENNAVDFELGQERVAADNLSKPGNTDANTLYAVWEIKKYTVTVEKIVESEVEFDKTHRFIFTPDFSGMAGITPELQTNFLLTGDVNASSHVKTFETKIPYNTYFSIKEFEGENWEVATALTVTDENDEVIEERVDLENGERLQVKGNMKLTFTNKLLDAAEVTIIKMDENASSDATSDHIDEYTNVLSGAKFTLLRKATSDGAYTVFMDNLEVNRCTTLPLPQGYYQLIETTSPDGYIISNHGWEFVVDYDGKVYAAGQPDLFFDSASDSSDGRDFIPKGTLIIANHPGSALPMTGGSGTLPYTLGGIALIMASALMYGFRMRRRERRLN